MRSLVSLSCLAVAASPSLHSRAALSRLPETVRTLLVATLVKFDALPGPLLAACSPDMPSLSLANTRLTDELVNALADGCSLRDLDVSQSVEVGALAWRRLSSALFASLCSLNASQCSRPPLSSFASRCPLLRSFTANDSPIQDRDVAVLLSRCEQLQELSLRRCNQLTNRAFTRGLRHGQRSFLLRLDVREVRGLTDPAFIRIAECCKTLLSLSLEGQKLGCGLTHILNGCLELEHLAIPLVSLSDESELLLIRNTSVRVRVLDLFGCVFAEGTLLFLFGNVFRGLRRVNLSGVRNMTREVFSYVCQRSPMLESLACKGHLVRFDDSFLEIIQKQLMPNTLCQLDLSLCRALTNEGLLKTFRSAGNSFRTLNLISLPVLTDDVVVEIARSSGARLEKLSLGGNALVTNVGVAALADHCTNLRSLCLKGCSVDDTQLLCRLIRANPGLRMLSLSGVKGCTDTLVSAVARYLPGIEELYLSGVAVSQAQIHALKNVHPKCAVFGKRNSVKKLANPV